MKTHDWYKAINKLNGRSLSCSAYAGNTYSAKMYIDKILVTWSASAEGDRLKINTPVGFEIVGVNVIGHDTASNNSVQIYNGGTALSASVSCSSDGIVRPANSLVKAQTEFNASDDDLYINSASAGASCTIVIDIVLED